MKNKKITLDTMLNLVAFGLPILILQLIILPIVGNNLGSTDYGNAITIISFSSFLSIPLGSVLNNIRLLKNNSYREENTEGDFNIILVINIIINVFVMVFAGIYYGENFYGILLIIFYSTLILLREYILVSFRIDLNYKAILLNNVWLSVGYILGLLLFLMFGYWQFIYVVGNLFSVLFIVTKSTLLKEPIARTPLFQETAKSTFVLLLAMILNTGIGYADKLILYPLIGPTAVSIYYSATLIGKIISMVISPLSNVFLSYSVKIEKLSNKTFLKFITILLLMGMVGYIVIVLVSWPITEFLYPLWYQESLKLIPITSLTAIIAAITSVINPMIMRFKNLNWQLVLNGVTLVIYIGGILICYNLWGIIGFCIGVLVANVFKLLFTILVFFSNK